MTTTHTRSLLIILVLAFLLRAAYALTLNPQDLITYRSDPGWYIASGYTLVTGQQSDIMPIDPARIPTAPLFLLFVGTFDALFGHTTGIIIVRLIYAGLGTLSCYLGYRLALRVSDQPRAGLWTAALLAISPAFVMEAAQVLTETLYITLLLAGFLLYLNSGWRGRGVLMSAALFGLATLTRAVLIAFPLALALYLWWMNGWRKGFRWAALFLLVYGTVTASWTVANLVLFNRLIIGAQGWAAFIYIGATGWSSPQQVDQVLTHDAGVEVLPDKPEDQEALYAQAAQNVIGRDVLGWLRYRLSNLAQSYLQPHGTVAFGGESLKNLVMQWLRQDRSLSGLLALMGSDAFWPKLALYVFHFGGFLLGALGMWLCRKNWRLVLPLLGLIGYYTAVHSVLYTVPRYMFPLVVVMWVFAGVALAAAQNRMAQWSSDSSKHR